MAEQFKVFLAWLWVALCALAIFLVVPTARAIQKFVSDHWGRPLFGYFVLAATAATFLIIFSILFFRLKIRSLPNYLWLFAVAAFYVYFTLKLWQNPEEAVHFLEYGLLGFFLFRALRFSIKDRSIYCSAFFIGLLVGIFDEIMQWAMPGRYWDLRDVGLNALAIGLFQVALWKGIYPKMTFEKLRLKSLRITSLLLGANLILLGLCLSNTPERVSAYTELLRFLAFLEKEEPMQEFKIKHKDEEIGTFYSRLTVARLKKIDKENAEHYALILKEWKNKDYAEFLNNYTSVSYPFLYEMRVHLFRRDRKYEEGSAARKEEAKKKFFFVALKENQILEKYFSQTLKKSSSMWTSEKIQKIELLVDKSAPYSSPVSKDFFSGLSERAMRAGILVLLITLAVFNFWYGQKIKLSSASGRNKD